MIDARMCNDKCNELDRSSVNRGMLMLPYTLIYPMSLPECWDTRRAGTNEGYFDFQHFAFFAHPDNRCKFILAIYSSCL